MEGSGVGVEGWGMTSAWESLGVGLQADNRRREMAMRICLGDIGKMGIWGLLRLQS